MTEEAIKSIIDLLNQIPVDETESVVRHINNYSLINNEPWTLAARLFFENSVGDSPEEVTSSFESMISGAGNMRAIDLWYAPFTQCLRRIHGIKK